MKPLQLYVRFTRHFVCVSWVPSNIVRKNKCKLSYLHISNFCIQGLLVTMCDPSTLYLWSLKDKVPCILHTLELNKERFVCMECCQCIWLSGHIHKLGIKHSVILWGGVVDPIYLWRNQEGIWGLEPPPPPLCSATIDTMLDYQARASPLCSATMTLC